MKSSGGPAFRTNLTPRRSPRFLPVVRHSDTRSSGEIEVGSSAPKMPSSDEHRNGNPRRSSRLTSTANAGLGNGVRLAETPKGKSRRGSRVSKVSRSHTSGFGVKTPYCGETKKKTGEDLLSHQNPRRSPRFSVAAACASSEVGITPRRSSRLAEEAARRSELERSSGNDARGDGRRKPAKKVKVIKRRQVEKMSYEHEKQANVWDSKLPKERRLEEEEEEEEEMENGCVTPAKKKRRATIGIAMNGKTQLGAGKIELDKPVARNVAAEGACSDVEWTNEQSNALHFAYTSAKPSPHFWKKVSKMVPGKSAKECFDRIHSNHPTPPLRPPRPVMRRKSVSPLRNFNILGGKTRKIKKSDKQRFLAQKTTRHILRKHCLTDHQQGLESDMFSVFETAKLSPTSSHTTRDCEEDRREDVIPTRLVEADEEKTTSPEVLKPVRNVKLHEKYIDQLLHRNMKREVQVKKGDAARENNIVAAKELLVSEAKEAIGQYRHHMQVDMQRRYLGYNGNDCDDDDNGDGKVSESGSAGFGV